MIIRTPTDALDYKNEAVSIWRRMKSAGVAPQQGIICGETALNWQDHLGLMSNALPILWQPPFREIALAGARQLVEQRLKPPGWVLPKGGHWHIASDDCYMTIRADDHDVFIDSILLAPIWVISKPGPRLAIRLFTSKDPVLGDTPPSCVLTVDFPWPCSPQQWEDISSGVDGTWKSEVLEAFFIGHASEIFITQSVLKTEQGHVERHTRKRMIRAGVEPLVHVVRLRKAVTVGTAAQEKADIEWTCQWMVRGHWRQQYHPSDGSHQLTWIMPYVKGPEDKPFRRPAPEVAAVVR